MTIMKRFDVKIFIIRCGYPVYTKGLAHVVTGKWKLKKQNWK